MRTTLLSESRSVARLSACVRRRSPGRSDYPRVAGFQPFAPAAATCTLPEKSRSVLVSGALVDCAQTTQAKLPSSNASVPRMNRATSLGVRAINLESH